MIFTYLFSYMAYMFVYVYELEMVNSKPQFTDLSVNFKVLPKHIII